MVLNVFMGPNTRLHKAMGFLAVILGVLWFIEVLSELLVLEGAYLGGSGYVSLFFGLFMVGGHTGETPSAGGKRLRVFRTFQYVLHHQVIFVPLSRIFLILRENISYEDCTAATTVTRCAGRVRTDCE